MFMGLEDFYFIYNSRNSIRRLAKMLEGFMNSGSTIVEIQLGG